MVAGRAFWRCLTLLLTSILLWPAVSIGQDSVDPVEDRGIEKVVGQGEERVSLFYLTTRKRVEGGPASDAYGGERGEPHFGRCEIEFTPIPLIDKIASRMPFYLKSETNLLALAEPTEPERFWRQLGHRLESTPSGPLVLFVHGYNYGFERTCRMAAEMQRSLQQRATVVVFSWPSNGMAADYVRDQADVEWSVPALARFITELAERFGSGRMKLVAHSLGSRGVIFALQRMAARAVERPLIEHLVLLAPDFDSQTFAGLLPDLAPLTGGITLYASSNDMPLKLSHQLSGYPRLGEGGEHLTLLEGVETIDVSSIGRYQISGHEYFHFHPMVAADLATLLVSGESADRRPGLRPGQRDGSRYWTFVAAGRNQASGLRDEP